MTMGGVPPELAGLSDAEDFFEALGVPFQAAVLSAHRLQIMKLFGLASESWLEANPVAPTSARREALARTLREVHAVFAEEGARPAYSPFGASRLVRLGRRS